MKRNSQGTISYGMNRLVKLGLVFAAATALAGTVDSAAAITVTIAAGGQNEMFSGPGTVPFNDPNFNGWAVNGNVADNTQLGIANLLDSVTSSVRNVSALGNGTLVITVTATGLSTFAGANALETTFHSNPITSPGGSASLFTLLNGTVLGGSAIFDTAGNVTNGSAGPTITPADLTGPFSLDETFIFTSFGVGSAFNAGIDTVAVPGPIVGAGLPGLIAALGGLVAMARRRRNQLA